MIKWFNMVGTDDFNQVGGKGYNLSKMYKAGLNVPNGFIILSNAYDNYIKENNLNEKIQHILENCNETNKASELIKKLFIVDLLPQELKTSISNEFDKISSRRVAVRSSSTVEDLPGMSFAGQYN